MFNEKILKLTPYAVSDRFTIEDPHEWLFLDWNETNYALAQQIQDRMLIAIKNGAGVRYADGDDRILNSAIAEFTNVSEDNILVYNGSDSALNNVFAATVDNDDEIAVVEPEYNQINTFVHMSGGSVASIFLDEPYKIDINELIKKIKDKKGIYLSNPSNPTGRLLTKAEIAKLLDTNVMVLLDEAYVEFCKESCSELVNQYTNLFIFRTFSKAFGLAGTRLGYVISHPQNIKTLAKSRNNKEINIFAQTACLEALGLQSMYESRINEIILEREKFRSFINKECKGFSARPSNTNFVVVESERIGHLFDHLLKNKIMIRDRRGMYKMDKSVRVTIGTPEEMRLVKSVIKRFLD